MPFGVGKKKEEKPKEKSAIRSPMRIRCGKCEQTFKVHIPQVDQDNYTEAIKDPECPKYKVEARCPACNKRNKVMLTAHLKGKPKPKSEDIGMAKRIRCGKCNATFAVKVVKKDFMIPDENGELQEAEKIQLESMCPECEKFNHVVIHNPHFGKPKNRWARKKADRAAAEGGA